MAAFPDPAQPTVFAAFADSARTFAERPFLRVLPETAKRYGIAAGDISYREALAEVERLREIYRRANYAPGARVGMLLDNRPVFFLHWLALNALGVSVVPISGDMRPAEMQYLLAHSEVCVVVTDPSRAADVSAVTKSAGLDLSVTMPEAIEARAAALSSRAIAPGLESECALLYTSGTTDRPKGCVLDNRYYLQAGLWYTRLGELCDIRPGAEVLITPLPLHHMNAMAFSTMAMILSGGCIVQLDRFHPDSWWESVRTSGATLVHYLGVMPSMLIKAPESPADRHHSLRFGFGAGVDKRLHAPFETRFGFPLIEAWAMTETGAGAVVIAHREPRYVGHSCFGKPAQELATILLDDEGRPVAAGIDGELLVRAAGPDPRRGFFREYLKDPAATAEAWRDGWFHTGDVVRADDDGNLYFVDRKKNVIRRSGENISALEVESVLRSHAQVQEVAVAATPDEVRGDEVLACVIAREAMSAERQREAAADLVRHCLRQLAYHKAPGWVAFVDELPLTASQKLQRGELKKLAMTLPGQQGVIDTRPMKRRPR